MLLRISEYRSQIVRDVEIQVTRTFLANRDDRAEDLWQFVVQCDCGRNSR